MIQQCVDTFVLNLLLLCLWTRTSQILQFFFHQITLIKCYNSFRPFLKEELI